MHLNQFFKEKPNLQPMSQYYMCSAAFDTQIDFYNYFGQVFRGKKIDARLHIFFFDEKGDLQKKSNIDVASDSSISISARKIGLSGDGILVVAAEPLIIIDAIAKDLKLQIKPKMSTGFYMHWQNGDFGSDLMHEWEAVLPGTNTEKTFHIGVQNHGVKIESGLILMNTHLNKNKKSDIRFQLRCIYNNDLIAVEFISGLNPMGSKKLFFRDIFGNQLDHAALKNGYIIDVIGKNIAQPLTIEVLDSGDFHLHHL